MHEHWCAIGNKKERRGIISSALKLSTDQNKSVTNTFESHEKEVAIVMESILTKKSVKMVIRRNLQTAEVKPLEMHTQTNSNTK